MVRKLHTPLTLQNWHKKSIFWRRAPSARGKNLIFGRFGGRRFAPTTPNTPKNFSAPFGTDFCEK